MLAVARSATGSKCDGFLGHRARQVQWVVMQPQNQTLGYHLYANERRARALESACQEKQDDTQSDRPEVQGEILLGPEPRNKSGHSISCDKHDAKYARVKRLGGRDPERCEGQAT